MKHLAIATNLSLPIDVVTQKLAFMGRTGSGKTYAATMIAELMLRAKAQIIALDPVGVWYGLRLDHNGKDPSGIEIPVFGGLHGDIPLEATGGALLADLLVDRALSAVLDVSMFEHDTDKARFARDFAARFFFRKKASPSAVHIFLEECQEFVPQNPQKGDEKMLHEFHRIAKQGRNFGIGISLISQRPQEINKKALNQTECMFAFQMTGPQERKAISLWVSEKGVDVDVADVLPKLKVGEAHVWSPQWLEISREVKIWAKLTYNASSTPTFGAKAVEAKPLGSIDLKDLEKKMASTIEKAKETDPKTLKAEIMKLRGLLTKAVNDQHVPKPVIDQGAIEKAVARVLADERKLLRPILDRLQRVAIAVTNLPAAVGELAVVINDAKPGVLLAPVEHRQNPPSPVVSRSGSSPERRAGGSFLQNIRDLAGAGYINRNSAGIQVDELGRQYVQPIPRSGGDLAEMWLAKLDGPQSKMLDVILRRRRITTEALATELVVSPTTGSFLQNLRDLRNYGVIEWERGVATPSPMLS